MPDFVMEGDGVEYVQHTYFQGVLYMPRIKATPESVGIGARIRDERERLGLTREKMAEVLDITPGYIADLERGEARLSVQGLINLCQLFHCSSDYLLFGRTDSLSMAARIDALPPVLRHHIEELIARQLTIIQCAEGLGRDSREIPMG